MELVEILKMVRDKSKQWLGSIRNDFGAADDGVPVVQPFGLRFQVPANSVGLLLQDSVDAASDVVLPVGHFTSPSPAVTAPGEGGLVCLGEYRVYVRKDGQVVLAAGVDGPDGVAVGSKVLAELEALQATVDSLVDDFNSHVHKESVGSAAAPGPTSGPLLSTYVGGLPTGLEMEADAPAAVGPVVSDKVRIPSSTEPLGA